MPQHLHLDFETFSEIDLRDVGAYRYAFDPSTEILCAAMALGDEEPVVWVPGKNDSRELRPYFEAYKNPEVLIYCHNAMFEMAICQALSAKTFGRFSPNLSRFRCTMSLARRASLPAKLETLGEALGLDNKKDNRGKALIKKFCMMQPAKKPTKAHPKGLPIRRIRPEDEPEAFAEFCEYCIADVKSEQEVARRLAYFDEPINNANYSLDAVINARGVPVNLSALRHAQKLIDEETEIVSAKFLELTGFEVTQNARLLEWLNKGFPIFHQHEGLSFTDLQAETVDNFLEEHTREEFCPQCKGAGVMNDASDIECEGIMSCCMCGGTSASLPVQALRLKQSIAYAAPKKVAKMLECAGPHDNKIRGMLAHHLATTGRWGANLVQFQNMKRPTIKWSEDAYRDICNGISRDMLELNYGPVLEVISSCIRHFVDPSDDYLL